MNIDSASLHSSQEILDKRKSVLLSAFSRVLDSDAIITDVETQKPYECDGLAMYCALPLLVVMPETVAQVQAIMRICNEHNVPVVARGAGTGLSAGAMPPYARCPAVYEQILTYFAHRPQSMYRDPSTRGAQSGNHRNRCHSWSVLRARPLLPNRLFYWR